MVGQQRSTVHPPRQEGVIERLADRQRTSYGAVVDTLVDIVGVEAGGHHVHRVGPDPESAEYVGQPDALPGDRADGAELPLGAGGRGALLGAEEAAAVAGALVDRRHTFHREPAQVAQTAG